MRNYQRRRCRDSFDFRMWQKQVKSKEKDKEGKRRIEKERDGKQKDNEGK